MFHFSIHTFLLEMFSSLNQPIRQKITGQCCGNTNVLLRDLHFQSTLFKFILYRYFFRWFGFCEKANSHETLTRSINWASTDVLLLVYHCLLYHRFQPGRKHYVGGKEQRYHWWHWQCGHVLENGSQCYQLFTGRSIINCFPSQFAFLLGKINQIISTEFGRELYFSTLIWIPFISTGSRVIAKHRLI